MKKVILTLLVAVLLVTSTSITTISATSLSQIEKDIKAANDKKKAAERQAQEAARKAQQAEQEKNKVQKEITSLEQEIQAINAQINEVAIQRSQKEQEQRAKEEELIQLAIQLDELNASLEKTQSLKDTRTRLMFTSGAVSYLDVLLNATSFADFINRFDAIQSILHSDQQLIKQIEETTAQVELTKQQQELEYNNLLAIIDELTIQEAQLAELESQKEVYISQLNTQIQELDDHIHDMELISEEQEALMVKYAAEISKLNKEKNRIQNPYTGGKLGMPIDSKHRVTSNYGVRIHPITKVEKKHTGIDFGAPSGTSIYAAESGVVILSEYWSGYGNCIIIDHGNGLWTLYGHIKNGGLLVKEGDSVKRGDKIALVGSTGNSTGPHLHFEVRKDEVPVNPSSYLQ